MRHNKLFDNMVDWSLKDKSRALRYFRELMLTKTSQIFEYRGLPESIPEEILERFLQANGNVLFHEVDGTLYVFTGGMGGVPDVYYRGTEYLIANPALNYSKSVKIGTEGVVMRNDAYMQGLLPIIYKYGTLLIEADISFYNAIVNTRDYNAFAAGDDKTRASAVEYQKQIEAGNTSVIAENQLLEGLRRLPTAPGSNTLQELRETYQYIKSLLYSELGMKTAHNMKSQYVSEEENIINDDTLIPFIDNMLTFRKNALKEVNEMFGTNIEVELRGTWALQQIEVERAIDIMEQTPLTTEEGDELHVEEQASEITAGESEGTTGETDGYTTEETAEGTTEETAEGTTEGTAEGTTEETTEETTEDPTVEININIDKAEEVTVDEEPENPEEVEEDETDA